MFIAFLIAIEINIHCQTWKYESGENASGGKYTLASVVGTGYEFPNNEPLLGISHFEKGELNIYVTKVGCACCDNLYAIIKFDKSSKPYLYKVTTNTRKDAWYIGWAGFGDLKELLNNIKSHTKMYVRLKSDCGQNDFEFLLTGSSVPVNDVTTDYLTHLEELEKEKARLAKLAEEEKQRKEQLLLSEGLKIACIAGDTLKYVFYRQKSPIDSLLSIDSLPPIDSILPLDSVLKYYVRNGDSIQLQENEKILFSNCTDTIDYCILHKASSFEFYDSDTIFYIYKKCINITTIEEIE
jgi:hypothetical protein